ncbi:paeninodin family lasso peptide [Jeotgalibacillus proteolyticus]|nr:paeninodin family lasso peptide [Jeotgalibacillus proteolyticus]
MKEWKTPTLEALEIVNTMAGPGFTIPDADQPDPDETIHFDS